jgi:RNA-directed DNA polymerase
MVMNAPDLWEDAYHLRYANPGNMTAGTSGLTIDGYSEERAANLRELLRENRYEPTPVRRVYIPKANGKMRPLGIPDANDKQVQDVWRMILEALYEPLGPEKSLPNGFKDSSHGFRPKRSCHTALKDIQHTRTGVKWFVEFDIEGFFDNIDHQILMQLLEKKIDDWKFLRVIKKMLEAGYMEDWKFHHTHSGTPQGGTISPMLANIYLHELDCFMEGLISEYNKGKERRSNLEYRAITDRAHRLNIKIQHAENQDEKMALLEEKRTLQRQMLEIPSTDQHDPGYRRLRYCRYADDFLLGVIGPKSEALAIMEKVKAFLHERLRLKHSEAKTGLKHNSEIIRFLGYDITVINSEKIVKCIYHGQHVRRRTGKAHITLYVPQERLQKFATDRQYGNWESLKAAHKPFLMQASDVEITKQYSTEMRGLAEYYKIANNSKKALWGKIYKLWSESYLKTLAAKHQTSVHKMATTLNRGEYLAVRVYGKGKESGEVKHEEKLFDLKSIDKSKDSGEKVDNLPLIMQYTSRTELQKRREARKCEYCEREEGYFEVHHIRKLADIKKGKAPWEKLMIARRRKTLVLCIECHDKLHAGTLPDRRFLVKE